eukprot:scaffold834_cov244-Pinguiococcus_pyrenoidosus.AAC.21
MPEFAVLRGLDLDSGACNLLDVAVRAGDAVRVSLTALAAGAAPTGPFSPFAEDAPREEELDAAGSPSLLPLDWDRVGVACVILVASRRRFRSSRFRRISSCFLRLSSAFWASLLAESTTFGFRASCGLGAGAATSLPSASSSSSSNPQSSSSPQPLPLTGCSGGAPFAGTVGISMCHDLPLRASLLGSIRGGQARDGAHAPARVAPGRGLRLLCFSLRLLFCQRSAVRFQATSHRVQALESEVAHVLDRINEKWADQRKHLRGQPRRLDELLTGEQGSHRSNPRVEERVLQPAWKGRQQHPGTDARLELGRHSPNEYGNVGADAGLRIVLQAQELRRQPVVQIPLRESA